MSRKSKREVERWLQQSGPDNTQDVSWTFPVTDDIREAARPILQELGRESDPLTNDRLHEAFDHMDSNLARAIREADLEANVYQ